MKDLFEYYIFQYIFLGHLATFAYLEFLEKKK